MTTTHRRVASDIRVNMRTLAYSTDSRPHQPKAATPSHIVPRRQPQRLSHVVLRANATVLSTRSLGINPNHTRKIEEADVAALVNKVVSLQSESLLPLDNADQEPVFVCEICREAYVASESKINHPCKNQSCKTSVCRGCFHSYVSGIVLNAPYTLTPIKCIGCRVPIQKEAWVCEMSYRITDGDVGNFKERQFRDMLMDLKSTLDGQMNSATPEDNTTADDIVFSIFEGDSESYTLNALFGDAEDSLVSPCNSAEESSPGSALSAGPSSEIYYFDEKTGTVLPVRIITRSLKVSHNEAVTALSNKYAAAAESIMGGRCASCHNNFSLAIQCHNSMTGSAEMACQHIEDIIRQACGEQSLHKQSDLLLSMEKYLSGEITAAAFIDQIEPLITKKKGTERKKLLASPRMHDGPRFKAVLDCVRDIEKRTAAHLALLKKRPLFRTPCCKSAFCFNCKVSSHHSGFTCTQRLSNEYSIGVQCCPRCGVPTIRSEGCNHIICPCGMGWSWR